MAHNLFSLFRWINILLSRNFMSKVPNGILVMSFSVFEDCNMKGHLVVVFGMMAFFNR